MILPKGTYFVTGIDTDAGKSVATGVLARLLAEEGASVMTQKFVQTGNEEFSEDIAMHRNIMGIGMQEYDLDHTTAPEIFPYPASPHFAAQLAGRKIDLSRIENATRLLAAEYDIVLIEGAGGLMVPLDGFYTTADYIAGNDLPVIIVTSGKLGSINHTLLTLEVCHSRGIKLAALVFNHWPKGNPQITVDTLDYFYRWIDCFQPGVPVIEIPVIEL